MARCQCEGDQDQSTERHEEGISWAWSWSMVAECFFSGDHLGFKLTVAFKRTTAYKVVQLYNIIIYLLVMTKLWDLLVIYPLVIYVFMITWEPSGYDYWLWRNVYSLPWKITMLLRTVNHLFRLGPSTVYHGYVSHDDDLMQLNGI